MSATILLILRVLLAASLYAFIGLAFYLIWRDLQQQTLPSASRLPPTLTLVHITDEEPVPLSFTTQEIVIGRDPSCDFRLEDSTVSAQHSRLTFRRGHWWIEDLRSTNGTSLNQEPVTTPMVIASGDELRCGQITLMVTIGESS